MNIIDQHIIRKALNSHFGTGGYVRLNDGEEWIMDADGNIRQFTDADSVMGELEATEEDIIFYSNTGRYDNYVGFFHLIHGNSPGEIIAESSGNSAMDALYEHCMNGIP